MSCSRIDNEGYAFFFLLFFLLVMFNIIISVIFVFFYLFVFLEYAAFHTRTSVLTARCFLVSFGIL